MGKNLFALFGILVLSLYFLSCAGINENQMEIVQEEDELNFKSGEKYNHFQLDNGLRVFVIEDHRVPLVTFSITYNVGSIDEAEGLSGMSHYLEHVMFLGTEALEKEGVFNLITEVGGTNNAATSYDFTTYFAEVPSERLELLVAIEADRMGNLLICPEEFERERQVIMQERRQTVENNLWSSIFEEVKANVFPNSSLNHTVIGWMEDIERISVSDMQAFYKQFYSPNNAVIVVSGDADTKQVYELIKKYFSHYEPQEIKRNIRLEPPQKEEQFLRLERTTSLPLIAMAYRTPEGDHPDIVAINAFLDILINDPNSRINRRLKNQMRIVLGGSGSTLSLRIPGVSFINLVTMTEDMLDMVKDAFDNEVKDIIENGITDEELQIVKKKQIKREVFSQKSLGMLARQIAINTIRYQDPDFGDTLIERFRELEKDDIVRVAEKYFNNNNRTIAYVVPRTERAEGDES